MRVLITLVWELHPPAHRPASNKRYSVEKEMIRVFTGLLPLAGKNQRFSLCCFLSSYEQTLSVQQP